MAAMAAGYILGEVAVGDGEPATDQKDAAALSCVILCVLSCVRMRTAPCDLEPIERDRYGAAASYRHDAPRVLGVKHRPPGVERADLDGLVDYDHRAFAAGVDAVSKHQLTAF